MHRILNILVLLLLAAETFAGGRWTIDNLHDPRTFGSNRHVLDYYEYLTREERDSLDIICGQMRVEENVETVVVIVDSINGNSRQLSDQLFATWQLNSYGNAILLLFTAEQQYGTIFRTTYAEEDGQLPKKLLDYINTHELSLSRERMRQQYYERLRNSLVTIRESIRSKEYREQAIAQYANMSGDAEWYLFDFFMLFWIFDIIFIGTTLSFIANGKKKIRETEKVFNKAPSANDKENTAFIYYHNKAKGKDWSVWSKLGCLRYIIVDWGFLWVLIEAANDGADTLYSINILIIYGSVMALIWIMMAHIAINRKAGEPSEQMMRIELVRGSLTLAFLRLIAPWFGISYTLYLKHKVEKIKTTKIGCPLCNANLTRTKESYEPEGKADKFTLQHDIYRTEIYRCLNSHRVIYLTPGNEYDNYLTCGKCKQHTLKKSKEEVIQRATYNDTGTKRLTYTCIYCGNIVTHEETIAKLVHSTSSSSGRSSYRSGSYSSSGGSRGGGCSGGGGAGGGW